MSFDNDTVSLGNKSLTEINKRHQTVVDKLANDLYDERSKRVFNTTNEHSILYGLNKVFLSKAQVIYP